MKVAFFVPPAERRTGGLDSAIDGLRQALQARGLEIGDDPTDCAVAHFHGLWERSFPAAAATCQARGIPYVVSPHGMLEPWAWRHKWWKKAPYFHLIERRFLRSAACVLATAENEARRLASFLPKQRLDTLPLGLTGTARPDYENARRQLGWKPGERVLLYLSRIHVKKGLDLLLESLAGMPIRRDTRLVIVGDGPNHFVRKVRKFAVQEASHLPPNDWPGAIWGEARWPYFQGADLFCLPSHSENFGLAVLEACQVGTPALTTTETPWAKDLASGKGYICPPTIEDLRRALGAHFASPPHDARARRALSDWAWENFNWDTLAQRYVSLYQSLGDPVS